MVVHHVEVHQVATSGLNGAHFFAQTGKVSRQDAGGQTQNGGSAHEGLSVKFEILEGNAVQRRLFEMGAVPLA
jgi:hypothetical protein